MGTAAGHAAIELIEHNKNGLLVDIGDEENLYQQMCQVADDKAYAEIIGKEASHLYDTLRTEKIAKVWIDYLEDVIHNG